MEDWTQVLNFTEINEAGAINKKARRVRGLIEFPKMNKDVTRPPNEFVTRLKEKNTIIFEKRSPKFKRRGIASRTREVLSPVIFPYSRVINSGFDTPSGHSNVSIAACIMKRKRTGPSHEPWRTPMVLFRVHLTNLHFDFCHMVKPNEHLDEMIRHAIPA